ncbi:MAG: hypothetical protein QOH67_1553 [Hyphomicrobiales bacterium]|jgi:hypothetical protein|nr:hypothetical protein [Hyphomicrobiales bacterium]
MKRGERCPTFYTQTDKNGPGHGHCGYFLGFSGHASRARAWLSAYSPRTQHFRFCFPNPDRRSPPGRAGPDAGAAPIRSQNSVCPHAENHVQVGLPEIAEENIGTWNQVVVAAAGERDSDRLERRRLVPTSYLCFQLIYKTASFYVSPGFTRKIPASATLILRKDVEKMPTGEHSEPASSPGLRRQLPIIR